MVLNSSSRWVAARMVLLVMRLPRRSSRRFSWALAGLAIASISCAPGDPSSELPPPIDPQQVQDQDDMTWDDYRPIPGHDWADRTLVPERGFRIALVAMDFPDQPFVITQPIRSVRKPAGRAHRPRRRPPVLSRLFPGAERTEPQPDHQRLLDGAVTRRLRHHRD